MRFEPAQKNSPALNWAALKGVVLLAAALPPGLAMAQAAAPCVAIGEPKSVMAGAWATSSNWQQLTADAANAGSVQVAVTGAGSGAGFNLNLARNWAATAAFHQAPLNASATALFAFPAQTGPIMVYLTHAQGTAAGVSATVTLCDRSGRTAPRVPPRIPTRSPVRAQDSGLPLSPAFVVTSPNYWANHAGVVAKGLTPECVALHDTFWTQGPDGKAYPTWHPPFANLSNGTRCYFGHEHGDDPNLSVFYGTAYASLRSDRLIPIPFGYANEVQAQRQPDHTQHRHEDHFGHKIFRERFEAAYGNSATDAGPVTGTGAKCDALLKLHQGTHSGDALAMHLHEAVAHVRCDALPNYPASRIHVTTLVPLGRPGWFTNNCPQYPVPGQTLGTSIWDSQQNKFVPIGENNAPVDSTNPSIGTGVVALGAESNIVDVASATADDIQHRVDGERIIPGAQCLKTYRSSTSRDLNNLEFGHAANDTWVRPLMISDASGKNAWLLLKSYYSVFNPARVFFVEALAQNGAVLPVSTRTAVEMCRSPVANGPDRNSRHCQRVIDNPLITNAYHVDSPFNGTLRNLNFKTLHIGNHSGKTVIYTDAFGREDTTTTDATRSIKQHVSQGYNGMAQGVAGSLAITNESNKVCRTVSGQLYPKNLADTDPCYWNGGEDLLFAKEWWRDFRVWQEQPSRVHAPN